MYFLFLQETIKQLQSIGYKISFQKMNRNDASKVP